MILFHYFVYTVHFKSIFIIHHYFSTEMKNKRSIINKMLFPPLLIIALCICNAANGQTAKSSDYSLNPSWVNMMSDPNENYYEVIKAYDDYWKNKKKPTDEAEEMEMMEEKNHSTKMTDKEKKELEKEERAHKRELELESKKKLTDDDLKQLEWKREMSYQCKRFEDWKLTVKPFVQNDGRILNEEERMKIFEQRQQESEKK